jgi:hypothetical protein
MVRAWRAGLFLVWSEGVKRARETACRAVDDNAVVKRWTKVKGENRQ